MFCEHGFIQENCPYCQVQSGIKPLIRLVKPAPRELSPSMPKEEHLLSRNMNFTKPLFESRENIHSIPPKLVRNFDLRNSVFNGKQSQFHQNKMEIEKKDDFDEILHNKVVKVQLEEIESKYTE